MAINNTSEKKNKGIAFVSNTSVDKSEGDKSEGDNIMKSMDRGRRPNVKNITSDIGKSSDSL